MSDQPSDPAIPVALAHRMDEMLRGTTDSDSRSADALLDAAIAGLDTLLQQPPAQHNALTLLAVDGLVTAAFAEVADAETLDSFAAQAAARLMALGNRSA